MLLDETYTDLREELAAAKQQAERWAGEVQALQQEWAALLLNKEAADTRVAAIELLLRGEGAPAPVGGGVVTFGDGGTQ